MKLLTRTDLLEKMDRGDEFKLAMTLDRWTFRRGHIPGSINVPDRTAAMYLLRRDEEVVVYCANRACQSSVDVSEQLVADGFTKVARYAGGLADWANAGLPLVSF